MFIQGKQPSVSKNSCGYNLFGLADGLDLGLFDLTSYSSAAKELSG